MVYFYLLIVFVLCFGALRIYFRIADRYNIIDKPNERSSHTSLTIRGGGVIFPLAAIISFLFFPPESSKLWPAICFLVGLISISTVSFWDDVSNLSNKLRILVHLFSVTLLMYSLSAFELLPWFGILCGFVVIIGTINAYNFMDGINGITGLYSLVVLTSIYVYQHQNTGAISDLSPGLEDGLLLSSIIACLVFLFFNFRKKAKCFAGDVGSVGIGFIVLYFVLPLVFDELKFVFFLAVYGVDTVLTILHRLYLRQNIFQAHRLHFYQILANEQKMPHRQVAGIYAAVQLAINAFLMGTDFNFFLSGLIVCGPLALIYILLKPRLMKSRPNIA